MNYEIIPAPDGQKNILYKALKACMKALHIKKMLIGTKEEVLARAAKMNARNPSRFPTNKKAHYTDHPILHSYHCLEIDRKEKRREKAILFVFSGGMILGSDKGDIGLARKIADQTRPENIVFLGFSSGGALILDLITYINELNDSGQNIPMPGLLIPVSPASIPVTQDEKDRLHELDSKDVMIPESYFYLAKEIMCCGNEVDEKYLATAHGDFRHAPETHFYYGSAETVYAFAPSYADSFKKAGAECRIHE